MFRTREEYNSPEYAQWRNSVYVRDRFKCVMCESNKNLNAHHIKRWADFPNLRFMVSNGVCLCGICHDKVTGKEEAYEKLFTEYVLSKKKGYKKQELLRKWKKRNCMIRY